MEQCEALTSSGSRCKHKARESGLCQLHRPQETDPSKGGRRQCQAVTSEGTQCKKKSVSGGYCGRHRDQITAPDGWQTLSESELAKRKEYALVRKHELAVAEEERRLVDVGITREETARVMTFIRESWATFSARRSHEMASDLGLDTGVVAATLEKYIRLELKQISDSL